MIYRNISEAYNINDYREIKWDLIIDMSSSQSRRMAVRGAFSCGFVTDLLLTKCAGKCHELKGRYVFFMLEKIRMEILSFNRKKKIRFF